MPRGLEAVLLPGSARQQDDRGGGARREAARATLRETVSGPFAPVHELHRAEVSMLAKKLRALSVSGEVTAAELG